MSLNLPVILGQGVPLGSPLRSRVLASERMHFHTETTTQLSQEFQKELQTEADSSRLGESHNVDLMVLLDSEMRLLSRPDEASRLPELG